MTFRRGAPRCCRRPEKTRAERLAEITTLPEALLLMVPHFTDTQNNMSPADAEFAIWASQHMRWKDFDMMKDSDRKQVTKDPAAYRGKLLCNRGNIVQIQTDRSSGKPIYAGIMSIGWSGTLRFAAVGSSEGIVVNSHARLCGIITGINSYQTQNGGSNDAIFLVGMFDIKENRAL